MKGNNVEHQNQESCKAIWTLELCPLQENVYYKREISIDLTPLQRDGKVYGIHPVFNNDGLADTQGFHLQIQKVNSIQSLVSGSTAVLECAREQEKEAQTDLEIQIPKPLSEKKICYVCRQRYTDYLEHIAHPSHKKKARSNAFSRHIEEMCQTFTKDDDKLFAVCKRKYEPTPLSAESEQNSEVRNRKASKKRFVQKPSNHENAGQTINTIHTFNNQERKFTNNYVN